MVEAQRATLMALTYITIEFGGTEYTLSSLGFSSAQLILRNCDRSELMVRHEGRAFDLAPLIVFNQQVVVRMGRTRLNAASPFTGGKIIFVGERVATAVDAQGQSEGWDYIFANAWYRLERLTYGQAWRWWKNGTPPTSGYVETSEVFCPTRVNTVTHQIDRVHSGDQIADVIDWAIAHGVNLQRGTITPQCYLPVDAFVDQKCSMVIEAMLKLSPDAVADIDMTTTADGTPTGAPQPTFRVIQRPQMADVVWNLSEKKITSIRITPREDMVASSVVIKYKRTDTINGGAKVLEPFVDAYPPGSTGFEDNALMQIVQLAGARVTNITGTVVSEDAPDAAALATPEWWEAHGVVIGNYDAIEIRPDASPTDLPYILLSGKGSVASWMIAEDGSSPVVESVQFTAFADFTDTNGSRQVGKKLSVKLSATNLASDVYSLRQTESAGEVAVAGLAQQVYESLTIMPHDGEIEVTEQECGTDLTLRNTLSIAGGTNRFAMMKAIVQEIRYDLDSGKRQAKIGWPQQLNIDNMIDLGRLNRTRRVDFLPGVQASGDLGVDGGDVNLPENAPQENAAAGEPLYEVHVVTNDTKWKNTSRSNSHVITRPPPAVGPAVPAVVIDATLVRASETLAIVDLQYKRDLGDGSGTCGVFARQFLAGPERRIS